MYCITTETGSVRMVERCGLFTRIARPGIECMVCCVDNASGPLSMRLQQLEVACEVKTKDNVFTHIKVSVQYQIAPGDKAPELAYYRLANPRKQIESYVYDVVRAAVPKIDLDNVFLEKEEISDAIRSNLKAVRDALGHRPAPSRSPQPGALGLSPPPPPPPRL